MGIGAVKIKIMILGECLRDQFVVLEPLHTISFNVTPKNLQK